MRISRRRTDFRKREIDFGNLQGIQLGQKIALLRKEKRISQAELARRLRTSQSVISRLESGQAKPSLSTLMRIAEALEVRLEIRFT